MQGTVYPGGRWASAGRSFGRKGFGLMQGESLAQSRAEPYPGIMRWATHMAFASPQCHRRSVLYQNPGCHGIIERNHDVELSGCVFKNTLDSRHFFPLQWSFLLLISVSSQFWPRETLHGGVGVFPTSPPWRSAASLLFGVTEFSRLILSIDLLLT